MQIAKMNKEYRNNRQEEKKKKLTEFCWNLSFLSGFFRWFLDGFAEIIFTFFFSFNFPTEIGYNINSQSRLQCVFDAFIRNCCLFCLFVLFVLYFSLSCCFFFTEKPFNATIHMASKLWEFFPSNLFSNGARTSLIFYYFLFDFLKKNFLFRKKSC